MAAVLAKNGRVDRDRWIDADQRPQSELATAQHTNDGFQNLIDGGGFKSEAGVIATIGFIQRLRRLRIALDGGQGGVATVRSPAAPAGDRTGAIPPRPHPTRFGSCRVRRMGADGSTVATADGIRDQRPGFTLRRAYIYTRKNFV